MAKLEVIDITGLDVTVNELNVRQDLHLFMQYVQERRVKRAYRTNYLAKSDYNRLAKVMSDVNAKEEIKRDGNSEWIDYVDDLALTLGFVSYDTKGEYVGYSSAEPTFRDNYIEPNENVYDGFLHLLLIEQERKLLHTLINDYSYSNNELLQRTVLGALDPFSSHGCATGVLPTLNFAQARTFLLDLLNKFESGCWYSVKSLIGYLKHNHRYFLIPKKPKAKVSRWRAKEEVARYGNFGERTSEWGFGNAVPDDAVDGFERVEGRYVERFLEGFPLVLGYVDVAYAKNYNRDVYPSINHIQAFRINERLKQVLAGNIPQPRVTVQPNFEIQVDSPFYPASMMAELMPITKVLSVDTLVTLKLDKKKVTTLFAQAESFDVIGLLKRVAGHRLPQNVLMELQEWASNSEKFVLFNGFFGILEGTDAGVSAAKGYVKEDISPTIKLIREPSKVFQALEEAKLVPLRMTHKENAFRALPEKSQTVFARKSSVVKPKEKTNVQLKRESTITLYFPNTALLDRFCKELIVLNCPVEPDKSRYAATYSTRYETEVKVVMKVLAKEYNINIQDI